MKLKLIAFVSMLSLGLNAQELPEEKSLLWEISGNGLEKNSYLYGTMHVSAKIAFRLDDVFFEALNGADMVALETDPSTWLEHYNEDGYYSNYYSPWGYRQSGFYKDGFSVDNPKKELVGNLMSFDNNLLNGILYRSSSQRQDFQEDTYLDMFIYQAGKKQNKTIVALEDLDESQMLVDIAAENSRKDKPEVWLQKLLVDDNYYSIMQEAYRTRNISLLDSLDRGLHTDHYMDYMLYKRNHNMVEVMDSIMKTGSVFSAIGAAHLPGEEGVIKLLRGLGYTVKAYTSDRTEVAENEQEKLEELFIEQTYTPQTVDDEYFTINLPDKLFNLGSQENITNYISTDLTNGAFVTITRISTKQFLKNDQNIDLEVIRDLLFENIPGDIEEKKDITNGPWSGIEVKNKLKNGDYQHYQIYVTPMEVIIFKLSGKKTFAQQYGDQLFASLKFKDVSNNDMVTLNSVYKDFSFQVPNNYSFVNMKNAGNRELEAYNSATDDYYFMKRVQLNDTRLFEVDTFELKQIQKRFYEDLEVYGDATYSDFGTLRYSRTLRSSAQIDSASDVKLHLMTLKQGMYFYLIGIKTKDDATAETYFNSFNLSPVQYEGVYKPMVDTFVHFSTVSFLDMSKKWNTNLNRFADDDDDDKKEPYEEFYKSNKYITENGDKISVNMVRYHDYEMYYNADSIWNYYERYYEDDYILSFKERGIEHGNPYHVMVISDTACSKAIKVKNVIKHGVKYRLEATIDTSMASNKFIDEFFDNFKPADTLIGRDIFEDKTDEFFAALRANDSIVLESYGSLIFTKEDIDSLKAFVDHFDFPDDKKFLKEKFIYRIGSFWEEDETVIPYLVDLYDKSYENSEIQTDILRFFARQRTKDATEQMMELLSNDIPLSAYSSGINYVFSSYYDTLELAAELFPSLMDYQSIDEYRKPIFGLLTDLRTEGIMKTKSVKKYRNQMLNDARIELKRQLAKKNNNNSNSYYGGYGGYSSNYNTKRELSELEQYIVLLFPFRNEKNMKVFFERLLSLDDHKVITTYIALQAKYNDEVDTELLEEYAKDINKRYNLYQALMEVNRLDLFPEEYKNQKSILESFAFKNGGYKPENDTITFLEQRDFEFEGKSYTTYFFKTSEKTGWNKDEWYIKSYTIANFEKKKDKDTPEIKNTNGVKAFPVYTESRKLLETVELDKQMQKLIEAFELKDHPRASSELDENSRYYGYY
ncbi:TraB/GumN family protein [Lishizhenia sp.]|uniref:TraB/GumN family protein n=1 Tax=Lishizhenia sp. TaxID=2497594 RepID=UPI00299E84E5|nr:TraB/GumN family protein [Lishizhenia sp.]MDX1444852.1 TraB/GumN family protein [Lishizhenia sp.]